MNKAILSILVANHFGVLNKVTGLFGRRGYNIKALSVGETDNPAVSRITVLTEGDEQKLTQICSQVLKLEEVYTAAILPPGGYIERELALIKIRTDGSDTSSLMEMVSEFSAKSAAAGECAIIEASGSTEDIDRLIERAKRFHIVELSRTGATALEQNGVQLYNEGDKKNEKGVS